MTHATPSAGGLALSVLVPVTLPEHPLDELYLEFAGPLKRLGIEFEFVFVSHEYDRERLEALRPLEEAGEPIRILVSHHTAPETALANLAVAHTTAPILLTLPSYPRIAAEALPELLRALGGEKDMVAAVRVNERDPLLNRVQRRAFHLLLRRMVGGSFRDIACGVRVMRREVLEGLDLYGDFFRFLPMLAYRDGFRVEELAVPAHRGDRKSRIYHPGVYLRRFIDLIGMMFMVRFTYKPLRFFGLLGSALAAAGGVVLLILFFERVGGTGIADRPLLLLGVLLVVLGLQALAMGLIGEIVVHHNVTKRPLYRLRAPERKQAAELEGAEAPPDGRAEVG